MDPLHFLINIPGGQAGVYINVGSITKVVFIENVWQIYTFDGNKPEVHVVNKEWGDHLIRKFELKI